jgi:hypothetical protein
MLFIRCIASHLHMNNKHCVILHSVLSKMPITTVPHNKDKCSKHPTDGCHLRLTSITLNTAADEHCTEVLTAVCYIVSTDSCRRFGGSRYLYLQFRKDECRALYQNSSTHPLSYSHRSCPYNICRRYRYETPNRCPAAAVSSNKVPVH